jgi:hypothetical protein
MNADDPVLDHLTEQIIGGAMTVCNALGAGFLEKVSACCATSATRAWRSGASCRACNIWPYRRSSAAELSLLRRARLWPVGRKNKLTQNVIVVSAEILRAVR